MLPASTPAGATVPTEHGLRFQPEPDESDPLSLFSSEVNLDRPTPLPRPRRQVDTPPVGTPTALKALKNTIASVASDTVLLEGLVSQLERRTAKLIGKDQSLKHADVIVRGLQQSAIETGARVQEMTRAAAVLEGDLARLQSAVQNAAGRAREHVEKVTRRAIIAFTVLAVGGGIFTAYWSHDPAVSIAQPSPQRLPRASTAALSSRTTSFSMAAGRLPTDRLTPAGRDGLLDAPAPARRPGTVAPRIPVAKDPRQPAFAGDLSIESAPAGARVLVDGRPVGETPLLLRSVRAGSHAVWIERKGYQRWTAAVAVSADKLVPVSASLHPER
ncbi:MAG: PEGA domain-containing protein [Betaproteobacteria bacterium]